MPAAETRDPAQGHRPPNQDRSRRTLERIVAATRELLEERSFERVAISEILAHSGVSSGSFYARFGSKDDLLPVLIDEYERQRTEHFLRKLQPSAWRDLSLRQAVQRAVRLVADHYRDHAGMVRAFILYFRNHPDAFGPEYRARLGDIYGGLGERLLVYRDEIAHRDPAATLSAVIRYVIAAAREQILFGAPPHAGHGVIPHGTVVRQLSHMMYAALTTPPGERE